jgi:hypothetical protein
MIQPDTDEYDPKERERLEQQVINLRVRAILYDAENTTSYEEEIRGLVADLEAAKGVPEYTLDELRQYHRDTLRALA